MLLENVVRFVLQLHVFLTHDARRLQQHLAQDSCLLAEVAWRTVLLCYVTVLLWYVTVLLGVYKPYLAKRDFN
jgi:hypothetical protein